MYFQVSRFRTLIGEDTQDPRRRKLLPSTPWVTVTEKVIETPVVCTPVVVWPFLLYCEMLGDISSYGATLQSEGK